MRHLIDIGHGEVSVLQVLEVEVRGGVVQLNPGDDRAKVQREFAEAWRARLRGRGGRP